MRKRKRTWGESKVLAVPLGTCKVNFSFAAGKARFCSFESELELIREPPTATYLFCLQVILDMVCFGLKWLELLRVRNGPPAHLSLLPVRSSQIPKRSHSEFGFVWQKTDVGCRVI